MADSSNPKGTSRQGWFEEFQRCFARAFDESFGVSPYADWRPAASEIAWTAHALGPKGEDTAVSLPPSFGWFSPDAVAKSLVARLLDDVIQRANRHGEGPTTATPHRASGAHNNG